MKAVVFSVVAGLLLAIAWPSWNVFPLLFCFLVPLFYGIDQIAGNKRKNKFGLIVSYLFVFRIVWIGIVSRWIGSASMETYLLGVLMDGILFSLVLSLALFFHRSEKNYLYIAFCTFWIIYELICQNWTLGIPSFTLGFGLGNFPFMIQHYKWIGVEGGTLWILAINFFSYNAWKQNNRRKKSLNGIIAIGILFIPLIAGNLSKKFADDTSDVIKVASLGTQFSDVEIVELNERGLMVDTLFQLSSATIKSGVDLLVWPETIIKSLGWIAPYQVDSSLIGLQKKLPVNFTLVLGGNTFSQQADEVSPYVRKMDGYDVFYLAHNTAFVMQQNTISFRVKEKFIPFQERVPFLEYAPFLQTIITDIGSNMKVSPYTNERQSYRVAKQLSTVPILCYESLFPLKMANFSKENAVLSVLANESWNTSEYGADQYVSYLSCIAIQSGIPIVKSSNNGKSAIILKNGDKKLTQSGVINEIARVKEDFTCYELIIGYTYYLSFVGIFLLLYLIIQIRFDNLVATKT